MVGTTTTPNMHFRACGLVCGSDNTCSFTCNGFEIGGYHFAYQLLERDSVMPPKSRSCFRWITDEKVDLRRAEIAGIDFNQDAA